jgi:hypothetical protein
VYIKVLIWKISKNYLSVSERELNYIIKFFGTPTVPRTTIPRTTIPRTTIPRTTLPRNNNPKNGPSLEYLKMALLRNG